MRVLATWLFIVPMLAFFSFSVVAGAKTFSKPDVGAAVEQLPAGGHVVEVEAADDGEAAGDRRGDGAPGARSIVERFKQRGHYVCTVNASQLAQIQKRYRTDRFSIDVGGKDVDIVAVYGANERELRSYLGAPGVRCVLVKVSRVFFLPFDAHTS